MSERPLSFCMVTTFYPPYHFGGDALYVYRLANALANRGHQVTVAHCEDAYRMLAHGEPEADYPTHPNVTVRRLRSIWGKLSPLATYLSGRPGFKGASLATLFRGTTFDVVHFHNVSLIGGPGVLRYGSGIKLYTMHEHWLVCPMHVLWKDNREPCNAPNCLRCTLAYRRPPQLWRYTGLLERELDHIDLFLSPSRFTIAEHQRRGFTRQIRHLPHFLPSTTDGQADLSPCSASDVAGVAQIGGLPASDREGHRPYFLYVGRLERLKGVQTLIEQFRGYHAADLVIVGEGEYGDELRRMADGLDHVRFLGRLHPSALTSVYAGALALIIPSIGYEVFAMVSLEAFAQRTPVIVRDRGGAPEAVQASGGGYVYTTAEELGAAMEALRRSPTTRRELGERGYRAFVERWSAQPHLAQYFEAIEEGRQRRSAAISA